jgi:hypothetical protein
MRTTPHSTHSRTLTLNGKTHDVEINVYVDQDDLTLDDVIGDAEDREELERKLEQGDMMIAVITVEANIDGLSIEGMDSLGGCYVENSSDVDELLRDHDMIEYALADLESNLKSELEILK